MRLKTQPSVRRESRIERHAPFDRWRDVNDAMHPRATNSILTRPRAWIEAKHTPTAHDAPRTAAQEKDVEMFRHIRTAARAATLGVAAGAMLVFAGTPAGAMPLHAWPSAVSHHHHRTHSTSRHSLFGVTPRMMVAASRVSRCEEGGDWHFAGSSFDGGIGWTPENWAHFRKPTWPRFMHDAPPHMQANALYRFVWHYRMALPDQDGMCSGY
jgi:hypothetical protein